VGPHHTAKQRRRVTAMETLILTEHTLRKLQAPKKPRRSTGAHLMKRSVLQKGAPIAQGWTEVARAIGAGSGAV
jgi:hypothetical protein